MKVVTFANVKGGVGKSLLVAHLATASMLRGQKVLIVDLDTVVPTQSTVFGCGGTNGVETVGDQLRVWTALSDVEDLRIRTVWPEADLVLVDSGPRWSVCLDAVLADTDLVALVATPEPHSLLGALRMARVAGGQQLGLIVNRCESRAQDSEVYSRVEAMCSRFLSRSILKLGSVPESSGLRGAWERQSVLDSNPIHKFVWNRIDALLTAISADTHRELPTHFLKLSVTSGVEKPKAA